MKKILLRIYEHINHPEGKKHPLSYIYRTFNWYFFKIAHIKTIKISIFKNTKLIIDTTSWKFGVHGYTYLYRGNVDYTVPYAINQYVKTGEYVIDVGANFGLWSFKMSELVGDNGRVFAFEPLAKNINYFEQNIKLNRADNITLFKMGLSDMAGQMKIFEGFDLGSTSLLGNNTNKWTGRKDMGEIRTIDSFNFDRPIKFIKIDVEGFELHVLNGAVNLINEYKPIIVFEINLHMLSKDQTSIEDIVTFFTSLITSFLFIIMIYKKRFILKNQY